MSETGVDGPAAAQPAGPDTTRPVTGVHTVVVGAGIGGLAVTRMLTRRGVPVLAFDEHPETGHTWRQRYDNLRLNSVRWLSQMPDQPLPKRYGRWVSRDDYAEYLSDYAGPVRQAVRTGVRVDGIERGIAARWRVSTSDGPVDAHHVVLATGLYHHPVVPEWAGRADFEGTLMHAAKYQTSAPFEGQDVVIVGAGVSGVDIAVDLLRRASGSLTVAVRTSPSFLPRELWGLPLQGLSVTNRYSPIQMQDLGGRIIELLSVGNLADTPLGKPTEGMFSRLRRTGVSPSVDDGVFVPAVRSGKVRVVGEVVDLWRDGVMMRDGEKVSADTVIAATGYRTGLESVLAVPDALDPRGLPPQYGPRNRQLAREGLHFVGYASPLTGHLREIGLLARRTARLIHRDYRANGADAG